MTDLARPSASVDLYLEIPEGICAITYDSLDVNSIIRSVGDGSAGGTAIFIGTTRNSFKGRVVTKLEYTAYSKLAIKTIAEIIRAESMAASRNEHLAASQPHYTSAITKCAVHHRLGTVPVGEPSIVIAVSSPHRKEAFVACERILEEVKAKAQIWKREYYEGEQEEGAEWKANRA